jgi:uncharacterized protein (DUF2141 family)
MRHPLQLITAIIVLLASTLTAAVAATLNLTVEDIRDDEGRIAIAIFSGEAGFPSDDAKAVKRVFVPLKNPSRSVTIAINDLPSGQYAIALFHDNNLSGKLETNLFGIPLKGYGFSNNVNPSLRSARFDEAVFTLPEQGRDLTIKMVYR